MGSTERDEHSAPLFWSDEESSAPLFWSDEEK
jgi:hypothetical protein